MTTTFDWDAFAPTPVIAIIRGQPLKTCLGIAEALVAADFSYLEVTMNTPGVAEIIEQVCHRFPELHVGAGTVCTTDNLTTAIAAGARFVVTPVLAEAVVTDCVARGIPVFPGAYTPTEIYRAWQLGATAVKVFPAGELGPNYISDLSGPLPQIKLIPTGGVSLDNIAAFFAAGAVGVGMGSSLLDRNYLEAQDYSGLTAHFRRVRQCIQ